MVVLHIDTGAEMRGGQHQVLLLLHALRSAGTNSVLLARQASPLWHAALTAGFTVAPANLFESWQRSGTSDLVHAHDARGHTIAAVTSRCPFVVSRRVAFPVQRSFLSRWKYRRPSRFLAVSQFVASKLAAAGIEPAKIDVVYDAIGAGQEVSTWRASCPAVALASRDPQKGRDLTKRAAELAGIPVVFSDHLAADLVNASMFVYITRSEGLGSAALLAMSIGVPVLASRVGGLTEVLDDGLSGILVENDPQKIAAAMRRILYEPGLAKSLAEHARARIAERFTTTCLLRATLASYGRALAV